MSLFIPGSLVRGKPEWSITADMQTALKRCGRILHR